MAKPFPFQTPAGRQLIQRAIVKGITDWVINHKGGRAPEFSGVGGELGARTARTWFPNMYSAYLGSGHWVRANLWGNSGRAMEHVYQLISEQAHADRWEVRRWAIGTGNCACLVYPGPDWQQRFDGDREKYGHKISDDKYRDAWVFDPWVEKKDGVYRFDCWRSYFLGDGPYFDGETAPWTPPEYTSSHLMERNTLP